MEHPHPQPPPATLHVVWPEHVRTDGQLTGPRVEPFPAEQPTELPPDYPLCKWEERFDICQMNAILHMLEHLTQGLPKPLGRMLLRRADQFPLLHGHFAPYVGGLGFHAEEGEIIGKDECWHRNEDGSSVRLW